MSDRLPFPAGGRSNLRLLLFVVILATAPLYCIGFVLWGVAPGTGPAATATARPSATLRLTASPTRTATPFRSVIVTATRPLPPTPRQFRPPVQQPDAGQQPQQQPPEAQPQPVVPQPVIPLPVQQPETGPDPALPMTETAVPIQQFDEEEDE